MIAGRFHVLGEPLRVRLLQALQEGERNVSGLVQAVGASHPSVSKHLRLMQAAGIVGRRPQGNAVYYFITDESVLELCDVVCASLGERLARDAKVAAELNRGMTARR